VTGQSVHTRNVTEGADNSGNRLNSASYCLPTCWVAEISACCWAQATTSQPRYHHSWACCSVRAARLHLDLPPRLDPGALGCTSHGGEGFLLARGWTSTSASIVRHPAPDALHGRSGTCITALQTSCSACFPAGSVDLAGLVAPRAPTCFAPASQRMAAVFRPSCCLPTTASECAAPAAMPPAHGGQQQQGICLLTTVPANGPPYPPTVSLPAACLPRCVPLCT
jgi:hypothetical protein